MNNKIQKEPVRVETQPNTTISRRYKENEYELFCQWSALPFFARKKMGIPTQLQFAKKYGVNDQTLTAWKHRSDYWLKRNKHLKQWGQELTPQVMSALYKKCIREEWSHPKYIELWLKYIEGWDPNAKPEPKGEDYIKPDDIKTLIDILPEEKRNLFYRTLFDLIDEAKKIREENDGHIPEYALKAYDERQAQEQAEQDKINEMVPEFEVNAEV